MSQVETQCDIGFQGSFSMCTAGQAKGMVSGQLPHLVTEPELQPPSLPGTAASAPLWPPGTPPIKCVILLLWPCLLERGRVASSTVRGDGSGSAPPQTSKEVGEGWSRMAGVGRIPSRRWMFSWDMASTGNASAPGAASITADAWRFALLCTHPTLILTVVSAGLWAGQILGF